MGRISDEIGRRIPIVVGCVIGGLPLMVIPFVSEFPVLLLLSVVYGFGFTTVTASTPALVSELVPKELVGTSMGFLSTIMDVGQTLGPIISGLIFATGLRYVGLFSSLTLVLMFSCIIFLLSRVAKARLSNHMHSNKL
jgi:MFS family permease